MKNNINEIITELEDLLKKSKEEEIISWGSHWEEGYTQGKVDAYDVALSLVKTLKY